MMMMKMIESRIPMHDHRDPARVSFTRNSNPSGPVPTMLPSSVKLA